MQDHDQRDAGRTVTLYVRSLAPTTECSQLPAVLDRLERLEERGAIDAFDLEVWGHELDRSVAVRTERGRELFDQLQAFADWAERTGRSLDSVFETRRIDCEITGEAYTGIVLPCVGLAEYEDGALTHFVPHGESDGGPVRTVEARLSKLAERAASTAPSA